MRLLVVTRPNKMNKERRNTITKILNMYTELVRISHPKHSTGDANYLIIIIRNFKDAFKNIYKRLVSQSIFGFARHCDATISLFTILSRIWRLWTRRALWRVSESALFCSRNARYANTGVYVRANYILLSWLLVEAGLVLVNRKSIFDIVKFVLAPRDFVCTVDLVYCSAVNWNQRPACRSTADSDQ